MPSKTSDRARASKRSAQPKRRAQAKKRAVRPAGNRGPTKSKGARAFSMHAHHSGLVPTLTHTGNAVPHFDVCRHDFSLATGSRTIVVCTNVGAAASSMWALSWVSGGAITTNTIITPALLTPNGSSGGPTAMRAMKMTVSAINTTQRLNQGGRLYTLNCDQRLLFNMGPGGFTAAEADTFFASVVQHPDAAAREGDNFARAHAFTCSVVDGPAYERFEENDGALALNDFGAHIAQWTGSAHRARPMSVVIFAFESPPVTQTYTLSANGAWYTRWPLNTVPGRMMQPIPTADASVINKGMGEARVSMHRPLILTG